MVPAAAGAVGLAVVGDRALRVLTGPGARRDAVALANVTAAVLPRFASEPHKDTRAPQNLYPIGGLERELRHRLGDQALLFRSLQRAAAA